MTASIQNLSRAVASVGDGVAIIAAAAAVSTPLHTLLVDTLGVSIPASSSSSSSAAVAIAAAAVPSGPLLLAVDGLPDQPPTSAAASDTSLALAVSSAGVVLVHLRVSDLSRSKPPCLQHVMSAIERMLHLRARHLAPQLPVRRQLIVAVADFDDHDGLTSETLTEHIDHIISSLYASLDLPDSYVASMWSDLFDLHVAPLRSVVHAPTDYARDVAQLADVLHDANKTYADAGAVSADLPNNLDRIAAALCIESVRDLPHERELTATFACNAMMTSCLEKFRNNAKAWKTVVDAGRIVRSFGVETDRLIERTLAVYDKEAVSYKSTRAFGRKREELNAALLSDSYGLFAKQILKVRENAYQFFRSKLAGIRINGQVEKNVRGAVRESETFFVQNAESLRSKVGNWRFDNERHELVNHMRDDATERLQLARLQGNYVPNIRAPIAFAFHTLLLAPFGRDSRTGHPHAEEMKPNFDPDKVKQPGMMRSRPYQRGHNFKAGSRDELKEEFVDMFSSLYPDAADESSSSSK